MFRTRLRALANTLVGRRPAARRPPCRYLHLEYPRAAFDTCHAYVDRRHQCSVVQLQPRAGESLPNWSPVRASASRPEFDGVWQIFLAHFAQIGQDRQLLL